MGENDFSQFYGKLANEWANTAEGKKFVNYLEEMVKQQRFDELSEPEKECFNEYTKFVRRDKYKVLYDKPAPWKDHELGTEFRNFLKDADKNNKKLSDEEKRCLNNLKDWEKEHPEESADLESGASFDLDSIRWSDINTEQKVAYFLTSFLIPTKQNKNTKAYVESEYYNGGKSPKQIASYAKQMDKQETSRSIGDIANATEDAKVLGGVFGATKFITDTKSARGNLGLVKFVGVAVKLNKEYAEKFKPTQNGTEQDEAEQGVRQQEQESEIDIEAEKPRLEAELQEMQAER